MGLALGWNVLACGAQGDPRIDTWPIGELTDDCGRESCAAMIAAARSGLDRRDPGHPEVSRVEIHLLGTVVDAQGRTILFVTSGGPQRVAVFDLADGSRRAIGVGYPGVSQTLQVFDTWVVH